MHTNCLDGMQSTRNARYTVTRLPISSLLRNCIGRELRKSSFGVVPTLSQCRLAARADFHGIVRLFDFASNFANFPNFPSVRQGGVTLVCLVHLAGLKVNATVGEVPDSTLDLLTGST